ncbi:MAG TPA: DUF1800 family protein, partial [Rhodanobacter sp.]|nr:DUF1800 family protein [Rhodanobacter sp.]
MAAGLLLLVPLLASARGGTLLGADDITWLRRDGFGLDSDSVARYRALGRAHLLDAQLTDRVDGQLPPEVGTLIDGFEATHTPPTQLLAALQTEQQRIKPMPDGPDKAAALKAVQVHANLIAQQAQQTAVLQAVYGPNQLKEQLVWFWLNHFSVYAPKGRVRWELTDYTQHTIRPHALGKFRDLVMATLESPAMLEFLDNAQNAKDHVNENYARELMELHTLGVGSGYTQQ